MAASLVKTFLKHLFFASYGQKAKLKRKAGLLLSVFGSANVPRAQFLDTKFLDDTLYSNLC